MDIRGHTVDLVLVEPACDIAAEYYASFTFDRAARLHLGLLSAQGGVDIEQVAARDPEAVARFHVDPLDGLTAEAVRRPGGPGRARRATAAEAVAALLPTLYDAYVAEDADLVEINPLVRHRPTGGWWPSTPRSTLDDNAAFRHPEWEEWRDVGGPRPPGAAGPGEGAQLRRPRRHRRHHRQRRRPGHEPPSTWSARWAARPPTSSTSAAGRAPTSWPPPSRWWPATSKVRRHLRQHLRRDHPGRRGGQRHPRGAWPRPTSRSPDRRPPRRHQRRGGPGHPRRPPVRPAPVAAHHARRGPHGRRPGRRRTP